MCCLIKTPALSKRFVVGLNEKAGVRSLAAPCGNVVGKLALEQVFLRELGIFAVISFN